MERKTLQLHVRPEWQQIESTRLQCEDFLQAMDFPADVRESLCMITSEFLENAIKYGAWIRSYQSPFQAYLERLKLVASQPMEDEESGLGLVRIAYEGEAIIDFFVDDNDTLSISALFPLTRPSEVTT